MPAGRRARATGAGGTVIKLPGVAAGELARTDALLDALGGRRAADSEGFGAETLNDPAVRMLGALIADVDEQPPLHAVPDATPPFGVAAPDVSPARPRFAPRPADARPAVDPAAVDPAAAAAGPSRAPGEGSRAFGAARGADPDSGAPADAEPAEPARDPAVVDPPAPRRGRRRGGPSTIVALGVAAGMLASTGVAAAAAHGGLDACRSLLPIIAGGAPPSAGDPRASDDTSVGVIKLGVPPETTRPPRRAPNDGRPSGRRSAQDPIGGIRDGLNDLLNPGGGSSRKRRQKVQPPPIVRDPIGTVDDIRRQVERGLGLPGF